MMLYYAILFFRILRQTLFFMFFTLVFRKIDIICLLFEDFALLKLWKPASLSYNGLLTLGLKFAATQSCIIIRIFCAVHI